MSRNGPYGQAWAPQRRGPAENDPYANSQAGQWPQQGGHPDSQYNGAPQGYNGNGQQGFAQPHMQGGYHYPQSQEPDPQYYPQQAQGHPQGHGQMPGFDRYPGPAQNGYQPQQVQWGQQDPRNYDLGSYPQTNTPAFGPAEPAPFGGAQQGYAEPEVDYDEGLADDDEESHGGRRWVIIAAALVGAICLGGGLAYTYKMLFTSGSNRAPIARAIDLPNKSKPTAAAKENAQLDKKLFTRLGEENAAADKPEAAAEAQEDRPAEVGLGGPRPVRIIPISPGGQGGGQVATTTTTGAVLPAKPGGGPIMIDTSGPRGGLAQQGAQTTGQTTRPVPPQTTSNEPVAPQKKVAVATPTNTPTTTSSTGGAPKVPVPKAKEAASGNINAPLSNGYVAVLSSQRSRMDAMKAYASIDQKYRDMLASSTFDVQEADLGEKGVWYRAVIGPPRSFDGAKKICEELKAAGYPSCWPARY